MSRLIREITPLVTLLNTRIVAGSAPGGRKLNGAGAGLPAVPDPA
jgi:hypothetical protein